MKLTLMITLGLLILNSAFGQKKYYNKNYQFDKESKTLSLIPIYNERDLMSDSLLSNIFNDNLQKLELISPFLTREIIESNKDMSDILNKIISKKYKKKELKTFPNLNTILSESEIEFLREELNNSDLILIPITFNIKTMNIYTLGSSNFRLYDLKTGDFIFECPNQLNVNIGGEAGAIDLTAVLISLTHEFYTDKFIKKNNIN